MTVPAKPPAPAGPRPSPSVRRRRAAVVGAFVAAFGGFAHFNVLLSAMPAYAVRSGAGPAGAGALTGALMAAALAVQPFTPRLFARLGRRRSLVLCGALLGLPCLPLPAVTGLPALTGLSAVRGLGFGILVVAGVTFTAELFPPSARGRALGLYGAVVGVAGILGAPLGVALARQGSYPLAFGLAAGGAALVVAGAAGFPGGAAPAPPPRSRPPKAATARALRPMTGLLLIEAASTTAYGVLFTFLPLAASAAPAALLAAQVSSVLARLLAGRLIDRHGARRVLTPAVLMTVLGTAAGAVPPEGALLTWGFVGGALVFGAGFGAVQSATLVLLLQSADDTSAGPGVAGVAWNIAFDAGTGLGSLAGGPLYSLGGPTALFPATAALLAVTLLARARGPR
ncbi:MFS transporter [Streptomyces sp. CAI-85]|uniref:MFS transporter n=1 Tax=Streptomyces sp. CAI-85 TaxID=1472662 RepID=UPI00158728D7|nr:MFS transporter [Streptomyces sp. CAI-85]NUV58229.1 MFS transporter [Streptomyces sp. CAI-85]